MLDKPDLEDQLIISRLQDEYGLQAAKITFLPLGADVNTAVYCTVALDGRSYFLKLRNGFFDEMTVEVPRFLKDQGVRAIITPLETMSGKLWGRLEPYTMILYPFIKGRDGYRAKLTDQHWIDFGTALKGIHSVRVPAELEPRLQREAFSPHWRERVREFQALVDSTTFDDHTAAKCAALMIARRGEIDRMLHRLDQLALNLQDRTLEFVLCHSDIHPGNLLIAEDTMDMRTTDSLTTDLETDYTDYLISTVETTEGITNFTDWTKHERKDGEGRNVPYVSERGESELGAEQMSAQGESVHEKGAQKGRTQSGGETGRLYIVDWDNPILAPKERDLMFIGAGMGWDGPREMALFYQGYSGSPSSEQAGIDRMAMAYYRYERIIEDIAAFCEQLLLSTAGGDDREQSYGYFSGQFLPGREVETAFKTDPLL